MYGLKSVQLLNIHTHKKLTFIWCIKTHLDHIKSSRDTLVVIQTNMIIFNKFFFMVSYRLCLFVQKPAEI